MDNIYYKTRREASVKNGQFGSRERTAELLGVSSSTLANYELGVTKNIPPDAVVMMSNLYNAPELINNYCAHDCPIGRGLPIPTDPAGIESTTLKLMKALSVPKVEEAKTRLLDVSNDGKLTTENYPHFAWLLSYFDDLTKTIGELRLVCHKLLADGGTNDIRRYARS